MSRSPNPVDVFIAGGGPAGLATAIAARRQGLSVIVADGAVPPIDKACGEGLMPDGVEALRRLGITIPESDAYPVCGIRFVSSGKKADARFPRGSAYGIRRTRLHQIMLDRAAACGVQMLWRAAVTGLHPEGALVARELVRARFVVGADGATSRVRNWAGLNDRFNDRLNDRFNGRLDDRPSPTRERKNRRFAFRRHYRLVPWTGFMELHWGRNCQVYVTPVGYNEVGVALISAHQTLRLDDALREFPELIGRLKNAEYTSSERGAITVTRRLRRVYRDQTVLVGDASGGVDAVTGEGLCLAFRQAELLADCLACGDLSDYQKGHCALLRRPALTARLMLFLAKRGRLRERTMRVFQSSPRSFARMLAMHVGEGSAHDHISNGIVLGWKLLKA